MHTLLEKARTGRTKAVSNRITGRVSRPVPERNLTSRTDLGFYAVPFISTRSRIQVGSYLQ